MPEGGGGQVTRYDACVTCIYRDECAGNCLGYVPDDETEMARAEYAELCADIERDERED